MDHFHNQALFLLLEVIMLLLSQSTISNLLSGLNLTNMPMGSSVTTTHITYHHFTLLLLLQLLLLHRLFSILVPFHNPLLSSRTSYRDLHSLRILPRFFLKSLPLLSLHAEGKRNLSVEGHLVFQISLRMQKSP